LSDGSSKLRAIDEETNNQIMHGCRFAKAHRAMHETLDPYPQGGGVSNELTSW